MRIAIGEREALRGHKINCYARLLKARCELQKAAIGIWLYPAVKTVWHPTIFIPAPAAINGLIYFHIYSIKS